MNQVADHGSKIIDLFLSVDADMEAIHGARAWSGGFGDLVLRPDLSTIRSMPWQPSTACVLCDVERKDGSPAQTSPRHILRQQVRRLAGLGLEAKVATELEFVLFRGSYRDAWNKGYRDLEPVSTYNSDHSLLDSGLVEPLLSRIRASMSEAGLAVEESKGECNLGQQEINFRHDQAVAAADGHILYKHGAKEIAAQDGYSLTFMPKLNEREGNSCHVHLSLQQITGSADGGSACTPPVLDAFVAGQLACMRDLMLFFAPNVNSYKRYVPQSFAPTRVAWGKDNRTCSVRVLDFGGRQRLEHRVSGGDVNPYLAISAIIAAGLHGLANKVPLEEECHGSAYETNKDRLPATLREAQMLFAHSEVARLAFGDEVVEHYSNLARVEADAFDAAITSWEYYRNFERF